MIFWERADDLFHIVDSNSSHRKDRLLICLFISSRQIAGRHVHNSQDEESNHISNKIPSADYGIVGDPEEDGFSITYHFDGAEIKAQDIFAFSLHALPSHRVREEVLLTTVSPKLAS